MQGYRSALAKAGLDFCPGYVVDAGYQDETGHEAMLKLLRKDLHPMASFATTTGRDWRHAGHSESGLRVPEDMQSGAGTSTTRTFWLCHLPRRSGNLRIGKRAANLLLERIASKRPLQPRKVLIVPRLVVRQSTRRIRP